MNASNWHHFVCVSILRKSVCVYLLQCKHYIAGCCITMYTMLFSLHYVCSSLSLQVCHILILYIAVLPVYVSAYAHTSSCVYYTHMHAHTHTHIHKTFDYPLLLPAVWYPWHKLTLTITLAHTQTSAPIHSLHMCAHTHTHSLYQYSCMRQQHAQ